jgi:hypothetical protein
MKKVFIVPACLLISIPALAQDNNVAYHIGRLFGSFLILALFAWFIFRLLKKSKK